MLIILPLHGHALRYELSLQCGYMIFVLKCLISSYFESLPWEWRTSALIFYPVIVAFNKKRGKATVEVPYLVRLLTVDVPYLYKHSRILPKLSVFFLDNGFF